MAFDAQGWLLVGMGRQYRNPKLDTPGDLVVIVSDTDGDGVADKTKVFATGFNCIQSLAWHVRPLRLAVPDGTNIDAGAAVCGRDLAPAPGVEMGGLLGDLAFQRTPGAAGTRCAQSVRLTRSMVSLFAATRR